LNEQLLEELRNQKYNNWGEREPIVCANREKIMRATSLVISSELTSSQKSVIDLHALTGCKGLEFVAFSNVKIDFPISLPNEVYLYPCFLPSLNGASLKDVRMQASLRMTQTNRFVYDGWLPIDDIDNERISERVRDLRHALSVFAIVSSSKFDWEPKYKDITNNDLTHHYTKVEIGTIEDLANAFTSLSQNDKVALFRSIGWIAQSIRLDDEKAKFLFCVLAIESLCTYIEQESDKDSCFAPLRRINLTKSERRTKRSDCIKATLDSILEDNPTKAVTEAYFDCVVGIKKRLKEHLLHVMGTDDEYVKLFFEGTDTSPSLYDLRHTIAHGTLDTISEDDLLIIRKNVLTIEKFALQYVWTVLHKSINVYKRSGGMKVSRSLRMDDAVISNRHMYNGPVDMGIRYMI